MKSYETIRCKYFGTFKSARYSSKLTSHALMMTVLASMLRNFRQTYFWWSYNLPYETHQYTIWKANVRYSNQWSNSTNQISVEKMYSDKKMLMILTNLQIRDRIDEVNEEIWNHVCRVVFNFKTYLVPYLGSRVVARTIPLLQSWPDV